MISRNVFVFAAAAALQLSVQAQTPAFPGALGFGSIATGGRNGTVYHVTTLADSGPGSFRDAVSSGNRTIVFDVGGYISLNSAVSCQGNLTIAGQTAPGGGIGFKGGEISFAGRANIIMRHVRIRPGSDTASTSDDALSLYQAKNAIFDHCSFEFAPWNNIDGVGDSSHVITNITFQNCIIANPTYQQFGCHSESVGGTWSWFYNVFANSHNRNPLAKVNTVFINNAEYNCSAGYTTHTSTPFKHDIVNNYFVWGPASGGNFPWYQIDNNQSMYFTGNLKDTDKNTTLNGSSTSPLPGYQGGGTILAAPWSTWVTNASVTIMSTALAWRADLSLAGALPRDEMDALVISQMNTLGNGTAGTGAGTTGPSGGLYTSQTQTGLGNNGYGTIVGGATPVDSDGDGMPDFWEQATGSNPNTANGLTNTTDGYTLLEHYLNFLAAPHTSTQTNTPVDIDLTQFTTGFAAGATYTVSGGSNGVVSLLNGTNAHFVPTAGYFGLGSFKFTVNDGVAMTNIVTVLITPISAPQDLTWHGDGSGNVWDTTNSLWLNGTNAATFRSGDTVTFDDGGSSSPFINIPGSVAPALLTVAAAQDYTFGGSGVIGGVGSLTKSGTGSLTLNNANTFTGGLALNSGTVVLASTTAAGSGNLTLSGGTLALTAAGGPAQYSNPVFMAGPCTVQVFGSGNNNEAFSGALSGSGNLTFDIANGGTFSPRSGMTMSGYSGTLSLVNSGTFRWQGGTGSSTVAFDLGSNGTMITRDGGTITLGSLTGGTGSYLRGAGSTANATTYQIGALNTTTAFSGIISNGVVSGSPVATAITKQGGGTLTLAGNNNYTGATTVSAGTLIINGNNGPSPATVSSGATLGGSGTIGGLVTVNSGGKIAPGNGPGTLNVSGGLTLNSASLNFDLANVTTAGSGVNDLIAMSGGALTLSGTSAVNPTFLNGSLANGSYTLISGGSSTTGSAANFAWSGPSGGRQTFTFNTGTPGTVLLVVGGSSAANLVWRGLVNNNWDTATLNWLNGASSDKFYSLDTVNFDNTGLGVPVVNLATALSPAVINVNSSGTYTFSGPGSISGPSLLTKAGSGTLNLNTTNSSFTGNIMITGGTLNMQGVGSTLGSASLSISGGGTFSLPPTTVAYSYGGTITVPAGQSGTVTSPGLANTIAGKIISGDTNSVLYISSGVSFGGTDSSQMDGFTGTINILSGATLRFSSNTSGNTYGSLNPTFVISGTLRPRNAGNTVQLGALSGSGSLAGPQSNAGSGDTLYVIGGNNVDASFNGNISSDTAVAGSQVIVSKIGTGTLTLGGASTFTGGTTVSGGTLLVTNTIGSGTGTGDLEIQLGATLAGNGIIGSATIIDDFAAFAPGNPTGTLTFTNALTLNDKSSLLFTLGSNSDSVVVNNDLFLTGELSVTNGPGFGPGNYTLFTCSGQLTFDQLTLVSAPTGYNYSFNTNTPGVVKLVVSLPTPPTFSDLNLTAGNLTLSGSNGTPLGNYYVQQSSNLINWIYLATNQFDANGGFNFTTNVPAGSPQNFFRLKLP